MINLTTIPASSKLKDIIHQYIIIDGLIPHGNTSTHKLIPGPFEFIFINLNNNTQCLHIGNEDFLLKKILVLGQTTSQIQIKLKEEARLAGIQIKSSGLCRMFNKPMNEIVNKALPLEYFIGKKAAFIHHRLLKKQKLEEVISTLNITLLHFIKIHTKNINLKFLNSLQIISKSKGSKSIKEVIKECKTSERTLERLYHQHIVLTPKVYAKIYRFNQVVHHMRFKKHFSTDIIYDLGYFDQAHFIKEFKLFTGLSPRAFLKNHIADRYFTGAES